MSNQSKKVYFASDFHLGAPNYETSLIREKKIVDWLNHIVPTAKEIYLVGDIFDFWFEYKRAVPRGFVRLLGKLAEIADSGIPIHVFTGNHDMWIFDYLPKELGVILHREPIEKEYFGKSYLIGHGDGLGPGDKGYKRMKKVFTNSFSKWLFRWLHPDLGVRLAQYMSVKNKLISGDEDAKFLGEDNEWLVQYCKHKLKDNHRDYFVFGHRHLPLEIDLVPNSKYINLGDWISYYTYGVFDGEKMELKEY